MDHLGGNIHGGDPYTYSPLVYDYVINRFGIKTILDLGSGDGFTSYWFHKHGIKVVAVDGLESNIKNSIYPAVQIDFTIQPVITNVDMVYCAEVVEHIEEKYIDNLVKSLQSGKIILMTHAFPEQGGHHHVNEQLPEYWINIIENNGYSYLKFDTEKIRKLAEEDEALHIARSGLLFYRR